MAQVGMEPYKLPIYCPGLCRQDCISFKFGIELWLSSIFTILTLGISIYHIVKHIYNFNNPFFQSKIIVIMIMPPFYCITSLGSEIYPKWDPYFSFTRDFYEAVLVFTFFYLIFSYLAYDREKDTMQDKKVYVIMANCQKQVHHDWPYNYCQKPYQLTHWKKAKYLTYRCKKFVLQFVIVKLVTTLFMYLVNPSQWVDLDTHPDIQQFFHNVYNTCNRVVWWILFFSCNYSLYYLDIFFNSLQKPLAPYSPRLKFLTVSITLFFTFWQYTIISTFQTQFLRCFDSTAPSYNGNAIVSSLINLFICFEMVIMAFAGGLAYNYENYRLPNITKKGSFMYIVKDTIKTFQRDFRLIKPKKFGFEQAQYHQIQLKEINWHHRQSAKIQSVMMTPLQQIIIDDYF